MMKATGKDCRQKEEVERLVGCIIMVENEILKKEFCLLMQRWFVEPLCLIF